MQVFLEKVSSFPCDRLKRFHSFAAAASAPTGLCALALYIIITMDVLLRTAVFLWISAGFLLLPEEADSCRGNVFPATCDFFVGNVCFEFVEDSKSWFEARSSCKKHGGELLKVMDSEVKGFLENKSRNSNNTSLWLEEGVQGQSAIGG